MDKRRVSVDVSEKLTPAEAQVLRFEGEHLIRAVDCSVLTGLRDRAIIGLIRYEVSVDAVAAMLVRDYYWVTDTRWIRLIESGTQRDCLLDHQIQDYIDEYLGVAGIINERTSFLFRSTLAGNHQVITRRPMNARQIAAMLRRRIRNL
jgi:hypothetical protein